MVMVVTQGVDIVNSVCYGTENKQQDVQMAQAKDWFILAVMKMTGVNPELAKGEQLTKLEACIASLRLDRTSCENLQLEPLSPRARPPDPQAAWFEEERRRERMQWELERATYLKDIEEWKRYGQKVEEELDETRVQLQRQEQATNEERQAWQRERIDLNSMVQDKEDEVARLHAEIAKLRRADQGTRVRELEADNAYLKQQLGLKDAEIARLLARISELERTVDSLNSRILDLEAENDRLRFRRGDGDDSIGSIGRPAAQLQREGRGSDYHVFTHQIRASDGVKDQYHVSFEEHPDQSPQFKIDLACRNPSGSPVKCRVMSVAVTYEGDGQGVAGSPGSSRR